MKRILISAVVAVGMLMVSGSALAGRPEARQAAQQARILDGVRSGELTGAEAVRLQAQHRRLNRQLCRDRIDGGGLSARERARIERRQDRLSRRIFVQKHDRQHR